MKRTNSMRLGQSIVGAVLVAATLFSSPALAARGDYPAVERLGLTREERVQLLAYKSITRGSSFTDHSRHYLTGISYQLVDMSAAELYGWFKKVDHTLPRALPGTYKARFVGTEAGLPLVEVRHGNAMLNGGYTVIWEPDDAASEIRFWMAPQHPHDVEDIWGFFRIRPVSKHRSLVTVALALDVGKGSTLSMYEARIHKTMLKSARYVRKFVDRSHGKTVK